MTRKDKKNLREAMSKEFAKLNSDGVTQAGKTQAINTIKELNDAVASPKDRKINIANTIINGVSATATIIGVISSAVITAVFLDKGFKLEETGTYATEGLKTLMRGLKIKH